MRVSRLKPLNITNTAILWTALLYNFISSAHIEYDIMTTYKLDSCSPPPKLKYGQLRPEFTEQSIFLKGSTVQYDCRPGYKRVPGLRSTITCMDDFTWSTPKLFCSKRSCGKPDEIENGYFLGQQYLFDARIEYFCNVGYTMKAENNYRDCTADGTWSNTAPECKAVECSPPEYIYEGHFSPFQDEYTYLDSVTYTCHDDLVLQGENSLFCTENGTWSSEAPKCTESLCPKPQVRNGKTKHTFGVYTDARTGSGFRPNAVVTIDCNPGYVINGSNRIQCLPTSEWSPSLPTCLPRIFCPSLKIENGQIKLQYGDTVATPRGSGYSTDSVVTIECDPGYVINGSNFLNCSNSEWTPSLPTCVPRVSCPEPKVYNGKVNEGIPTHFQGGIETGYKVMTFVKVACNQWYSLRGIHNIACGPDLRWHPSIPICQSWLDCTYPHVENGHIAFKNGMDYVPELVGHSFTWGDTVDMQCDPGFVMQGNTSSLCNFLRKWSNGLPTCIPELMSMRIRKTDGSNFTDSIIFRMTLLYTIMNRTHSACHNPPQLHYGELRPEFTNQSIFHKGSTLEYNCQPGYVRVPHTKNIITCLDDFTWSSPEVFCSRTICPKPYILNGSIKLEHGIYLDISNESGYNPNTTMTIACNPGYIINGSNWITCLSNGEWFPSLSTCVPRVSCHEPKIYNGEIKQGTPTYFQDGIEKGYKVMDAVKVKCDFLYRLKGESTIVCGSDLKWHPKIPICQSVKDCPYPDIENGYIVLKNGKEYTPEIVGRSFTWKDSVLVQCDPGFQIHGSDRSECKLSWRLHWSPKLPVCAPGEKSLLEE
ncbi:complement component receptor 1-like protein [Discoglossus pictus]